MFLYQLMQRSEDGTPDGVLAMSNSRETLERSITPDVKESWYIKD